MKKSLIAISILSFIAVNASNFFVIVDDKNNKYKVENKNISYTDWVLVGEECITDIDPSDIYFNRTELQTKSCEELYEREKTTLIGEEIEKETETKRENIPDIQENIVGTHLEKTCDNILSNNYSIGTGKYYVDVLSTPVEVQCDMTLNDGGWTLVSRLNTTDETTRRWDDSFWSLNDEVGNLNDNKDYISYFRNSDTYFKSIRLEFNYNNGVLISDYNNDSSTLNFHEALNLPISNNNIDFPRVSTNNADSADFFGTSLSFQVYGIETEHVNGNDRFRIWYNKSIKATCNQTGGIGTWSDIYTFINETEFHWWTEAGYPSSYHSCQENLYRSYLGTNKGGSHDVINVTSAEQAIGNPDYYTTDIINIYIK